MQQFLGEGGSIDFITFTPNRPNLDFNLDSYEKNFNC